MQWGFSIAQTGLEFLDLSHSPASVSWVVMTPRTCYYTWLYQHLKQTQDWPMLFRLFLCSILPPPAPHLTVAALLQRAIHTWLHCLSSCVLSDSKPSGLVLTSISKNTPVLSHWIFTRCWLSPASAPPHISLRSLLPRLSTKQQYSLSAGTVHTMHMIWV